MFIQQHNKWPEEDRFKREQAKQKKKAEKDKQMKLKSFKKDKESWSMDADEKLEQLAQIERDKQEAVEQLKVERRKNNADFFKRTVVENQTLFQSTESRSIWMKTKLKKKKKKARLYPIKRGSQQKQQQSLQMIFVNFFRDTFCTMSIAEWISIFDTPLPFVECIAFINFVITGYLHLTFVAINIYSVSIYIKLKTKLIAFF